MIQIKPPTETQIVGACLDYLHRMKYNVWRNNTGAAMLSGNHFVRYGALGSPDIIGMTHDGRFLGIEVKRPTGKPTEAQTAFLQGIRDSGGLAFVIHSVDELQEVLKTK